MQKIKVLSLFDGLSIAQQAFKELGFEVEYYASEIDKQAISITQKNHPNTEQLGDVKEIDCQVLRLSGVYNILKEYDSNIQNKLPEREMLYWLNEDFSISAKIGTQITNADSPESASLQRIEEIRFSRRGVGDIIKTQNLIGSGIGGENGNTQTQELLLQCGEWGYVYRSDTRNQEENIKRSDWQKIKTRKHRENTTSGTFSMGNTTSEKETLGTDKERNVGTEESQEIPTGIKEQKEWGASTTSNRKEYARSKIQGVSFPLQAKNDNEAITQREWFQLSIHREMETTVVKTSKSINIFLGKFELVCGGSPCQDLSIAKNKREGLNGKRSGLFWDYVRILKDLKPKYFVLENVASMPKEAKNAITEALWGIKPIMIDASLFSAQQRKRLFWIGKLADKRTIGTWCDEDYKEVDILQPEDRKIYLKDILESGEAVKEKAYCLTAHQKDFINDFIKRHQGNYVFKDKPIRIGSLGKGGQGDRIYSIHGKSVCLSANGGGRGAKTGLYLITGGAKRTREGKGKTLEIRKDGKSNSLTTVSTDSLVVLKDYFRPLTPIECERLQSLTEIEQSCIIKVCSDHQNNYVNAGNKNLKSLSVVGSVEKNDLNENVLSAEKNLNIKNLQTNKPVQPDVLINCGENTLQIHCQNKLLASVSGAEWKQNVHHLKKIEDFVHLLVGLNTIVEKTTPFGEAELPQKNNLLVVKESGNNVVNIYGKGITQLAEDAEKDLTTLNKLLKSTISDLSIQGSNEQIIQTLFSYVVSAILGYIPKEIQNQNILTFQIKSKVGYTYGLAKTNRKKLLGNGFNCAVIKHIIKSIL